MDIKLEFGQRVRELRTSKGMTQQELSDKCGYTDRSAIGHIERGDIDVPLSVIKTLAKALEVSPEYLAFGTKK